MIHSVFQTRVRYVETDRMGVVHHSNYLNWFEAARIQMLDEIGLPYQEMESEGYLIPVISAELTYERPSFFDDRLDVHLYLRECPRARFNFDYEVKRADELLARGRTMHGFMSPSGQAVRPPVHFVERIKEVGFASDEAQA